MAGSGDLFSSEVNMNCGSKGWESLAASAAIGLAQSGDTSLRSFCPTVYAVMPSILGPFIRALSHEH